MNLNELYLKISANFWKAEQITSWAKNQFHLRAHHRQTRTGASDAALPIILNSDGYVDPSFYDLADFTNFQHDHEDAAGGGKLDHTTALTNVGTLTHAQLDAHVAATAVHGATGAVVGTTNTQTLTNKTLTTPAIGSFTNAQHDHTNAPGGGQLDHGTALTGLTDDDHPQYVKDAGDTMTGRLVVNTGGSASSSASFDGDAILIRTSAGTGAAGTYGQAIAWQRGGTTAEGRRALIMPKHVGGDNDQVGLSFWGHGSATSTDPLVEQAYFNAGNDFVLTADLEAVDARLSGTLTAAGVNVGEDTLSTYNDVTATSAPTVSAASAPSSVTYSVQNRYYTRKNKEVAFQSHITWSAATGGAGQIQIPLPFTAYASSEQVLHGWLSGVGPFAALIAANGTFAVPHNGIAAINWQSSGNLYIGGTYFTA